MTPKQAASTYKKTKAIKSVMIAAGLDFYAAKALIIAGGENPPPNRRKSRLSKQKIVELYRTHSIQQIAGMNDTSNSIIIRVLHDAKVQMRPRGGGQFRLPPKHGHAKRALELGMTVGRYVRLKVVLKLGGRCAGCGEDDIRVLDVNHINGEGLVRSKKYRRCPKARYADLVAILTGKTVSHIDVQCCNCNRRHEYERGVIPDIPEEFYGDDSSDQHLYDRSNTGGPRVGSVMAGFPWS